MSKFMIKLSNTVTEECTVEVDAITLDMAEEMSERLIFCLNNPNSWVFSNNPWIQPLLDEIEKSWELDDDSFNVVEVY